MGPYQMLNMLAATPAPPLATTFFPQQGGGNFQGGYLPFPGAQNQAEPQVTMSLQQAQMQAQLLSMAMGQRPAVPTNQQAPPRNLTFDEFYQMAMRRWQ